MDSATRHARIARRFLVSIVQQYGPADPTNLRQWPNELEKREADTAAENQAFCCVYPPAHELPTVDVPPFEAYWKDMGARGGQNSGSDEAGGRKAWPELTDDRFFRLVGEYWQHFGREPPVPSGVPRSLMSEHLERAIASGDPAIDAHAGLGATELA